VYGVWNRGGEIEERRERGRRGIQRRESAER